MHVVTYNIGQLWNMEATKFTVRWLIVLSKYQTSL